MKSSENDDQAPCSSLRSASQGHLRVGEEDTPKLRALVRAALHNIDLATLDEMVKRAYLLGSSSCHRAMEQSRPNTRPATLAEAERMMITETYVAMRGNAGRTAQVLGIGRTTLYKKLRDYGLVGVTHHSCPNCGCNLRPSLPTVELPRNERNEPAGIGAAI